MLSDAQRRMQTPWQDTIIHNLLEFELSALTTDLI